MTAVESQSYSFRPAMETDSIDLSTVASLNGGYQTHSLTNVPSEISTARPFFPNRNNNQQSSHPRPSHIARSITQKSILSFGTKAKAPFLTLEIYEGGRGGHPTFTEGAAISGRVVLESDVQEDLEEITLTIRGWTPSLGQKSRHDIAYVEMKLPLPEGWSNGKLPAGQHSIPFTLPPFPETYLHSTGVLYDLPPSFTLNGFAGFVQYQLDAVVKRRARLGVEAKTSYIIAYIPRSRPIRPSPMALEALRIGKVRPGPEVDEEGWTIRSLLVEDGGTIEMALPLPLVYTRSQPITCLIRRLDARGESVEIGIHEIQLQQVATVGENALEGENWDERPVGFRQVIGRGRELEGEGEGEKESVAGWVQEEVTFPSSSKPNFTFPNFSLGYKIAFSLGTGTPQIGTVGTVSLTNPASSPYSPFSGNPFSATHTLDVGVVICTHPFSMEVGGEDGDEDEMERDGLRQGGRGPRGYAGRSRSRSVAPAATRSASVGTNTSRDDPSLPSNSTPISIRIISGPYEIGTSNLSGAPSTDTLGNPYNNGTGSGAEGNTSGRDRLKRRLMGGGKEKRAYPRVGPSDWQPVGHPNY